MDGYKTIQFKEVKIMEITIKGTEEEIKNLLHITEKESDKEQNHVWYYFSENEKGETILQEIPFSL